MSRDGDPLGVGAKVVPEKGRWVVYLGVEFWDASAVDNPVDTVWHRIADFPSPRAAAVAARWYERGADRCKLHRGTEVSGAGE
jgi:hypothetical protein